MREFESIGEMLAAEDGTGYISGNSLSETAGVNVKYDSFLTAGDFADEIEYRKRKQSTVDYPLSQGYLSHAPIVTIVSELPLAMEARGNPA